MSANLGFTGVKNFTGATSNSAGALGTIATNIPAPAVRVFDMALIGTGGSMTLYDGTSTAGTPFLFLDKNLPNIHSNVGFRFPNGCFIFVGASTATVTFMTEF